MNHNGWNVVASFDKTWKEQCYIFWSGKILIQWTRTFLVASLCVSWSSQCVTELSHFCAFVRKTVKDPLSPAAPCDASRILKYICPSTISQFCSWNQILACYQFWQHHNFHSASTFQGVGCLFLWSMLQTLTNKRKQCVISKDRDCKPWRDISLQRESTESHLI